MIIMTMIIHISVLCAHFFKRVEINKVYIETLNKKSFFFLNLSCGYGPKNFCTLPLVDGTYDF